MRQAIERKALAYKFGWNRDKHERLDAMLAALPVADISHSSIYEAYATIDIASAVLGVKMGEERLVDRRDDVGCGWCSADHGRRLRSSVLDRAQDRAR